MCAWDIHQTNSDCTAQLDGLILGDGIVFVPGIYIILTQSTQHTERFSDPLGMYSMCNWGMHYAYSEYTTH